MRHKLAVAGLAVAPALACTPGDKPLGPSGNRAPEIRAVTITPSVIPLGGTATVQVDAVDLDGDRLFFHFQAEVGSVVADAAQPGRGTYVHDGSQRASDTVTVTVVDPRGALARATRGVPLLGNRPPAVSVNGTGACHPPCTVSLTATASDPESDPLSYLWTGCASGESATATCAVTAVGRFAATVVVSDGRGGLSTVTTQAEGVNRSPTIRGVADMPAGRVRFLVFETDPENDRMVCGWWGNCQCRGSNQSFNLECEIPDGLDACFQRFRCTDPFGATGETELRLPL